MPNQCIEEDCEIMLDIGTELCHKHNDKSRCIATTKFRMLLLFIEIFSLFEVSKKKQLEQ